MLEDFIIEQAKNLGRTLIKEILSDNSREFDNQAAETILKKYAIFQRLTAPYTPEQNGFSERGGRTVVQMAQILKY